MCKRKYELETILDVLNMADEIGATQTAIKLNIPINTVNGWRRVKSMPEIYPNHIITRHFQDLGHSNPTVTEMYTSPDKIEIKAENNSASVELKVDVKPDATKEIAGIYTMIGKRKDYMPEFRAFAVALAKNIGKKEAAAELGLKDSQIAHWIGDEQWAKSRIDLKKKQDAEWTRKRSEEIKTLQEENDKLRQYISNNIIASILQK